MSLYFYDTALIEKLRYWTQKTEIQIYGPDETRRLFEVITDKSSDQKIELPILCLRRSGAFDILNINKKPLTYDGAITSKQSSTSTQFDAIPIQINYQLDVYAKYLQEADQYIRNLIFNIINYPTMKIQIPYDLSSYLTHYANIRVASNVEDNSAIPERMVPGLFTRLTLQLNIDDAYLWDIRTKGDVEISFNETGAGLFIRNPETDDFTREELNFKLE